MEHLVAERELLWSRPLDWSVGAGATVGVQQWPRVHYNKTQIGIQIYAKYTSYAVICHKQSVNEMHTGYNFGFYSYSEWQLLKQFNNDAGVINHQTAHYEN